MTHHTLQNHVVPSQCQSKAWLKEEVDGKSHTPAVLNLWSTDLSLLSASKAFKKRSRNFAEEINFFNIFHCNV